MKLASIRSFDDKIISILNTEIPTESFIGKSNEPSHKCKQLKQEVCFSCCCYMQFVHF